MERYRAVCQHGEFTIQQRQCRALVRAGRQYADRLDAMFRTHSDVVGRGAAGLHAQSGSPPHAAVVGSPNCDGTAHDFVAENLRAPPAASAKPIGNGLGDPLASDSGNAKASVEENSVRPCHLQAIIDVWPRIFSGAHRRGGLLEERRKMFRDGGVRGVR